MIEVALPEELSALRAVFDDATGEVERIGILDESFSLDAVDGIDVAVPGLTLTTEHLGTDLAVVTATGGRVDATFDPALFPLGSMLREVIGDELTASQLSEPLSEPGRTVMLATVARDGRWYVSLGFTVAEYAIPGRPTGPLPVLSAFVHTRPRAHAFCPDSCTRPAGRPVGYDVWRMSLAFGRRTFND